MFALSPMWLRAFLRGDGMFIIQTQIDQKAMIALAKIRRKTLRRGRSAPVRRLAWFVVAVELILAWLFVRAGGWSWLTNVLMAGIMLACILGEDRVNGMLALRQVLPSGRQVNTTFKNDSCYIQRTQGAETWWNYSQIRAIGETSEYFALLLGKGHDQIYDKKGFSWGNPEEFGAFIQRKTGLKIQHIK